jgi:hypothetical protein
MACTSLNLTPGLFINTSAFLPAPSGSSGNHSVSIGANVVTVTGPTGSTNLFFGASQNAKWQFFGTDNHLAILIRDTGVGPQQCTVFLIDFSQTPPVATNVLMVLTSGSNVDSPHVFFSQGNGGACIVFGTDGTQIIGFSILRSDTGALLLQGPPPFVADGDKDGEVTATELKITYNSGGTHVLTGPLPLGHCKITPATGTFSDVTVGGCPVTPPTVDFTIKNDGDDCLAINNILASAGPFSLVNTSVPLPATLAKTQSMIATVRFQPGGTGTFTNDLTVTSIPALGDNKLHCTGKGVAAQKKLTFNHTTIDFGNQPALSSTGLALIVINNGTAPVNVAIAAGGGTFQWGPFNGTIDCGNNQPIPITFVPPSEGIFSTILVVGGDATGSPFNITLKGGGCVANSVIVVPPVAPIDFGQVEQGFRTVRFFVVHNTGDGPLSFSGTITGPDVALFGLQNDSGSITNVVVGRTYSADPVTACGALPTGAGNVAVGIAFFANVAPKSCSATLTLSGSNATNVPPAQTWTFPLTAEIVAPAAVDAGLIIDHSGSMNDPLGTKKKIDAAVAGAQLFVEMLRTDMDDRVNVVKFNQAADVVQPMVLVTSATSDATHERQSVIVSNVQTQVPPPVGNTAIASGCMTSFDEMAKPRATTPAILHKAAVLLTDGKDNTAFEHPPASNNWFSLKGDNGFAKPNGGIVDTSQMPVPGGVKFYAIALGTGTDVDKSRLDLVTAATGGSFSVIGDLTGPQFYDLEKRYLQILMEVTGSSMITDPSFTISPGQVHEFFFEILRGDIGGTVVMFDFDGARLPFVLIAPNGEVLDVTSVPAGYQTRIGSTHTTRFIEFRVPALQPNRYAGTWKVVVLNNGKVCFGDFDIRENKPRPGFLPAKCQPSRTPVRYGISIAAGSNFRLQAYVTPGPVYVGDPILLTGVVAEAGLPVLGCNVTVVVTSPNGVVWPTMKLYDDGGHNDTDKNDGEYANTFTKTFEGGTYTFTFRAEGKSHDKEPVVRELQRFKMVTPKYQGPPEGDHCCQKLPPPVIGKTPKANKRSS